MSKLYTKKYILIELEGGINIMFESFRILKEASVKLWPYFTPSYYNLPRNIGLFSAIVLVPTASVLMPRLFLKKDDDSDNNGNDLVTALASASAVALLNGVQQSLSSMLSASTSQAIKKHNVQLLMNDSKFLIHGDSKNIKSIQYVTVGPGVRDFAAKAVPIFAALPMYTTSSASILVYIYIMTESFPALGFVSAFVAGSTFAMYLFANLFSGLEASNQKVENELVGRINFIEANRTAISLMGVSDSECESVIQSLQKVNASIPLFVSLFFFYHVLTSISPFIASQFFGGYYTDHDNANDDQMNMVLNIMIMSLITNVQQIIWILTNNYSHIKLNLEQLRAFDTAYNQCLLTRNMNNKMEQVFEGNHLSLTEFSVYRPEENVQNGSLEENVQNGSLITILNKVTLELSPNKIYRLSADSGAGKTTLLKAITNNWQYTDGIVQFPESAKDNIRFIPQHAFIPKGTLLEILTYPLKLQEFLTNSSKNSSDNHKQDIRISTRGSSINDSDEKYEAEMEHDEQPLLPKRTAVARYGALQSSVRGIGVQDPKSKFIEKATELLTAVRLLLPDKIKPGELETEDINWNERLSGGEKQKIMVIQAILADPKFIIMDEATCALDLENKKIIYRLIKDYVAQLENYTVIYTDHVTIEDFADATLKIVGETLQVTDNDSGLEAILDHPDSVSWHKYWYKYTKTAMNELLKLRLEFADIKENVQIINPGCAFDGTAISAEKLAKEISAKASGDKTLVILNLYNKHWVGLVVDKSDNNIKLTYIDSEQTAMPKELKSQMEEKLAIANPEYKVSLVEMEFEPQRYNNCGPELVENFVFYLTGSRVQDENAPYLHSKLWEQKLVLDTINQARKSEEPAVYLPTKSKTGINVEQKIESSDISVKVTEKEASPQKHDDYRLEVVKNPIAAVVRQAAGVDGEEILETNSVLYEEPELEEVLQEGWVMNWPPTKVSQVSAGDSKIPEVIKGIKVKFINTISTHTDSIQTDDKQEFLYVLMENAWQQAKEQEDNNIIVINPEQDLMYALPSNVTPSTYKQESLEKIMDKAWEQAQSLSTEEIVVKKLEEVHLADGEVESMNAEWSQVEDRQSARQTLKTTEGEDGTKAGNVPIEQPTEQPMPVHLSRQQKPIAQQLQPLNIEQEEIDPRYEAEKILMESMKAEQQEAPVSQQQQYSIRRVGVTTSSNEIASGFNLFMKWLTGESPCGGGIPTHNGLSSNALEILQGVRLIPTDSMGRPIRDSRDFMEAIESEFKALNGFLTDQRLSPALPSSSLLDGIELSDIGAPGWSWIQQFKDEVGLSGKGE